LSYREGVCALMLEFSLTCSEGICALMFELGVSYGEGVYTLMLSDDNKYQLSQCQHSCEV